jgi:hypothetical protein
MSIEVVSIRDGFLWAKLDPLPHHIDKLAYSQISSDKAPA